jgi:glycopeptide antibiotics resistance protein
MNFFFTLVLDIIFGILGGLIGYAVFKPKVEAMPPMPRPL